MKNQKIKWNDLIVFYVVVLASNNILAKQLKVTLVFGQQKQHTLLRRKKGQSQTAKILQEHKAKQNQPKIMKVHDPVPGQVLANVASTCLQLSKIVSDAENANKVEQGICTALAGFFNVAAQAMKSHRKQYTQENFIPLLNILDDQAKERIRLLILQKTAELQEAINEDISQNSCSSHNSFANSSN